MTLRAKGRLTVSGPPEKPVSFVVHLPIAVALDSAFPLGRKNRDVAVEVKGGKVVIEA